MSDPLALRELSDPARVAATAALLSIAAADGVADDDEIVPLIGALALDQLDAGSLRRVARALIEPEPVATLSVLSEAPVLVRAGLLLRMVEVAGSDEAIAPGEVARLHEAGALLGVSEDQLGAMRAFLLDLERAVARGPADTSWYRLLVRAGGTLLAAGIPAGAVTWCGVVRRQLRLLASGVEAEADACEDRARGKAMAMRARALERLARQRS